MFLDFRILFLEELFLRALITEMVVSEAHCLPNFGPYILKD